MRFFMACYIPTSRLVDLIQLADKQRNMFVTVQTSTRLSLGTDPLHPTKIIDLSTEQIQPYSPTRNDTANGSSTVQSARVRPAQSTPDEFRRSSGKYWFELHGKRVECRSQKEVLIKALRSLENDKPGTLEKLSSIKPRSRHIVARDRQHLFENEKLQSEIEKYSKRLSDGWWVGTNNSWPETNVWLERACDCAGLKWGEDFKTSLEHDLADIL